ncbi:MAG: lysylphosphatidylglycerol synthase transmembrane domain-containing protein [Bacillota bacterium]|nr:lysylphosphatidylglycerol synthase transmembrane domain-containing protein [Bacillota bacterium]
MKKKVLTYLFTVILMFITIRIIFLDTNIHNILSLFHRTIKIYIFCGMAGMVSYWILDAVIIYDIAGHIHHPIKKLMAFKSSVIGQYYGMITPFSTGSQPAQVYFLGNNLKIPYGDATAILLNKYAVYQVTVTFYCLSLFLSRINVFSHTLGNIIPFVVIGLSVHLAGTIFIISIIYSPKLIERFVIFFLAFGARIKLIKNKQGKEAGFKKYMEDYKKSLALVTSDKYLLLKLCLITVLQLTINFSISFFVAKALNISSASLYEIICLQSLLYMAVSFIPTPGSLGTSEVGYYAIFKVVFSSSIISYALLLWRGISYYFNLAAAAIVLLIFYIIKK